MDNGVYNNTNYYATEGISYDYPVIDFANKTQEQVEAAKRRGSSAIWLLYDYGPFHNLSDPSGRNFLYCDGHVSN